MAEWVENNYKTFVEVKQTTYLFNLDSIVGAVVFQEKGEWRFNLEGAKGRGPIESPNSHLVFNTPEEAKEAALVDACYLVGQLHQTLVDMRVALSNQIPRD